MLNEILAKAIKANASDIHVRSREVVMLRIEGALTPLSEYGAISEEKAQSFVEDLMNDRQKQIFSKDLDIDFAMQFENTRFRVNAFRTIYGAAASLRLIPQQIKTMEELEIPQSVRNLCRANQGLILFTGPTGSGKSTSLAAMIDDINTNRACNIITIEDPIEFIHKSKKSLIAQRQVGENSLSFAAALRGALREDPNVILVGEMRDLETIQLALTAAETGHLVFATLHTNSAAQTINRIIDVFPHESKAAIRSMLSTSLRAIISQRLIISNEGRCSAFEVLLVNHSIRNLIREDQIPQIQSMMEIGKKHGMITLKDSILELIAKGSVKVKDAEFLLDDFG